MCRGPVFYRGRNPTVGCRSVCQVSMRFERASWRSVQSSCFICSCLSYLTASLFAARATSMSASCLVFIFFVVFFCCRENKLSVRGPKKSAAGPRVSPCGGRGVSCVVAFSGQCFKELRPALAVPGVALRGPGPVAFLLCIVAGAFPLPPLCWRRAFALTANPLTLQIYKNI